MPHLPSFSLSSTPTTIYCAILFTVTVLVISPQTQCSRSHRCRNNALKCAFQANLMTTLASLFRACGHLDLQLLSTPSSCLQCCLSILCNSELHAAVIMLTVAHRIASCTASRAIRQNTPSQSDKRAQRCTLQTANLSLRPRISAAISRIVTVTRTEGPTLLPSQHSHILERPYPSFALTIYTFYLILPLIDNVMESKDRRLVSRTLNQLFRHDPRPAIMIRDSGDITSIPRFHLDIPQSRPCFPTLSTLSTESRRC
jgi:hypothetical protein